MGSRRRIVMSVLQRQLLTIALTAPLARSPGVSTCVLGLIAQVQN